MSLRTTRTFATLEVSSAAYNEIKNKLVAADYAQYCIDEREGTIDMNGIALVEEGKRDLHQGRFNLFFNRIRSLGRLSFR